MGAFQLHTSGRLLVNKDALLLNRVFTEASYRNQKSKGRFEEYDNDGAKWVYIDSLTDVSREKVKRTFTKLSGEYSQLLQSMDDSGMDCVPTAIEFTAETLQINEPFIRSAIETYMNTHYSVYTWAYLDAGLHSDSVKGYSKQCALVQWIADFVNKIEVSEADAKRQERLIRSFRMNLLTAVTDIELEIKIPTSETRFNKWFDDILKQMRSGMEPVDIIQIKRQNNSNRAKITPEQQKIAEFFQIEGENMSVPQTYKKWLKYGREHGWWLDENGTFDPPTEGRLYQLLRPLKNQHKQAKTDAITYRAESVPRISRMLPEKKNHVWVIDGTAHNENVKYGSKVRQHVYAIKIADVGTLRMVGAASLIGVREPFAALKEAILMGIRETGYKPAMIQCDRGPAWQELQAWCGENDIKLYPSIVGNARAKTIESIFNMCDNDITRFLKGFSGMNRTALHLNSRASERRENQGKQNARSASIAMDWIKNKGLKLWNERVIEQLEGKDCNKTPYELWEEKESYVPKLSYVQLCQLCGTLHKKKLTIAGLDIQHSNESYTYFPPIKTSEERAVATRIFSYVPMDAQTTNRLSIYILNGGEPAPVFDHENRYLGVWTLKERTAYIAETKEEKELLNNYIALQYRVEQSAKEHNAEVIQYIEKHPDYEAIVELGEEMLTGKHRPYTGRYDKSELLEEEISAKANDIPLCEKPLYKEVADCDTGEVYKIRIN
ncbi:MAG: transposase family protein [Dysgonomonas sp.]